MLSHTGPFTKVLNVMFDVQGKVVPVYHVLMTAKTTALYTKLFRRLTSTRMRLCKPRTIMIDFEARLALALRNVYPGVRVTGCRLHYAQSVYRKIKSFELLSYYNS